MKFSGEKMSIEYAIDGEGLIIPCTNDTVQNLLFGIILKYLSSCEEYAKIEQLPEKYAELELELCIRED